MRGLTVRTRRRLNSEHAGASDPMVTVTVTATVTVTTQHRNLHANSESRKWNVCQNTTSLHGLNAI